MTPGYSGTPLAQKLGLKPATRVRLVALPDSVLETLRPVLADVEQVGARATGFDFALCCVTRPSELARAVGHASARMAVDGMLWIAWPKKSSGVPTALDFDVVQQCGLAAGLVDVKVCAVDETWSGLKFVFRAADRARIAAQRARAER